MSDEIKLPPLPESCSDDVARKFSTWQLEAYAREAVLADRERRAQQQPEALAKHQPCGCVICTCEDEKQCQGCGAKHCGNRTDHPAYVKQQPAPGSFA